MAEKSTKSYLTAFSSISIDVFAK